jgi:TonB family protein
MKKKAIYSFLISIALFLVSPGAVTFAQNSTPTISDPPLDPAQYDEWVTKNKELFERSINALEKAAKSSSKDFRTVYQYGLALMALEDFDQAIQVFTRCISLHSQESVVTYQLARCNQFTGRFSEALELYKSYIRNQPTLEAPYYSVVNVLFEAKNTQGAIQFSEQLVQGFPGSLRAVSNLAQIYRQADRKGAALKAYEDIQKRWPDAVAEQCELVELYSDFKLDDQAMSLAQNLTARFSKSAEAWETLASIYQTKFRIKDAYEAYLKSIDLRPNRKTSLSNFYNLGYDALLKNETNIALDCYQRILAIEPDSPPAMYQLGRIFVMQGKIKEAEELRKKLDKKDAILAKYLNENIKKPSTIDAEFERMCSGASGGFGSGSQRPSILYQEKARYTDLARSKGIQGTVIVSLVFTRDGRVTNIRPVKGLPYGLTAEAMRAAQMIKFRAACKDGRPVSVRMSVEFTFNLM